MEYTIMPILAMGELRHKLPLVPHLVNVKHQDLLLNVSDSKSIL